MEDIIRGIDSEAEDSVRLSSLRQLSDQIDSQLLRKEDARLVQARVLNVLDQGGLEQRAVALRCLLSLITHGYCAASDQVKAVASLISQTAVHEPGVALSSPGTDGAHADSLHVTLIDIVTSLQTDSPDVLFGPVTAHFKPLSGYLVSCLDHPRAAVTSHAVKYWSQGPPPAGDVMRQWAAAVHPRLGKLVAHLTQCMLLRDGLAARLTRLSLAEGPLAVEVDEENSLRNYSALALEHLCRVYQLDALAVLRPLLERWADSGEWRHLEAATFCLAVWTQACGLPAQARDVLVVWVPRVVEGLSHEQPLVRAISCFAMRHFLNWRSKGVKDVVPRVVARLPALLIDSCMETRDHASRLIATLLAYGDRDLSAYMDKLVAGVIKTDGHMTGHLRQNQFEVIGHLFARYGPLLSGADTGSLVAPLLQDWRAAVSSAETQRLLTLAESLRMVIIHSRDTFRPYNTDIITPAAEALDNYCARTKNKDVIPADVESNVIAFSDILSSLCEGQERVVGKELSAVGIDVTVARTLLCDCCGDGVRRSLLALLGHITRVCANTVDYASVFDVLEKQIFQKMDETMSTNVLWATVQFVTNCTDNDVIARYPNVRTKLFDFLSDTSGEETLVVNASLAWVGMCLRAQQENGRAVRSEHLTQLCLVLQTPFTHAQEKVQLFLQLCELLDCHLKALRMDTCVQLCTAAAVLECHDARLVSRLRAALRDVRAQLGNAGWNKVARRLGPQLAYELRRRYKMY